MRLVIVLIAGVALNALGFVTFVVCAFWGQFSAWGVCGDGATEVCLRGHPSVVAAIGEAAATAMDWVGRGLVWLAILGLLALFLSRLSSRLSRVRRES